MAVLAYLYDAVGYTSRGSLRQPASVSDGGTPEVLLIWLAHGRSIGQVDRVLLTQNDGIWIQTIPSWNESGAPNTDQRGRWRRPADAESLTATLTKAGMLGGGAPTSSAPSASVPSASAVPAPSEVSAATGLPTLAVAVLAGLGGRSAHRSRTVEGREGESLPYVRLSVRWEPSRKPTVSTTGGRSRSVPDGCMGCRCRLVEAVTAMAWKRSGVRIP
jgi:hypothetical protein